MRVVGIAADVPPEAWIALLGAAAGWLFALATQVGVAAWDRRNARRTAALLIYAEIVSAMSKLSSLACFNEWSDKQPPRRSAWDAYAPALLYRASVERVGTIAIAYNTLEDVAELAADPAFDFRSGSDAEFLTHRRQEVERAFREVAELTGRSAAQVDEHLARMYATEDELRRHDSPGEIN